MGGKSIVVHRYRNPAICIFYDAHYIFKGWHEDIQHSTGIVKRPPPASDEKKGTKTEKPLPELVSEAIQSNMADYEWLRSERLIIPATL